MKSWITPVILLFPVTALCQSGDSSSFYFARGMDAMKEKRYVSALQALEKATSINPKYTDAFIQCGFTNLEMKRIDPARFFFSKANELDPNNQIVIKEMTQLLYNSHQYNKAIEFAKKCSTCDNPERIMALSYYQIEDYVNAEKQLRMVLAKSPNDAEANYTLGRNYIDMELYDKAGPYYEKAIQLDSSRSGWMYELGLLYYNNNNYKRALNYFLKAADKGFPQGNDYYENLGYANIYSGNFDEGERLLLLVFERKPGNKDILRDLAEIYYQRKMYDRALTYCQKLVELDAKDGKALYQAGMCFQKKGQKDRGQQMCDKAIEMDPSLASQRQKMMSPGL